jgi:hypothetical protein
LLMNVGLNRNREETLCDEKSLTVALGRCNLHPAY